MPISQTSSQQREAMTVHLRTLTDCSRITEAAKSFTDCLQITQNWCQIFVVCLRFCFEDINERLKVKRSTRTPNFYEWGLIDLSLPLETFLYIFKMIAAQTKTFAAQTRTKVVNWQFYLICRRGRWRRGAGVQLHSGVSWLFWRTTNQVGISTISCKPHTLQLRHSCKTMFLIQRFKTPGSLLSSFIISDFARDDNVHSPFTVTETAIR